MNFEIDQVVYLVVCTNAFSHSNLNIYIYIYTSPRSTSENVSSSFVSISRFCSDPLPVFSACVQLFVTSLRLGSSISTHLRRMFAGRLHSMRICHWLPWILCSCTVGRASFLKATKTLWTSLPNWLTSWTKRRKNTWPSRPSQRQWPLAMLFWRLSATASARSKNFSTASPRILEAKKPNIWIRKAKENDFV